VSEMYGSYMGFVDFDKVRYYDVREIDAILSKKFQMDRCLESDSSKRIDSMTLKMGEVDLA